MPAVIEITESLRAELLRLTAQSESPELPVRVARDGEGLLGLVRDELRNDDIILIAADQLPPLIASAQLAEQLEGAILHVRSSDDIQYGGAGLVLLQPRAGMPRPEWKPPKKVQQPRRLSSLSPASLFRRRAAPVSTPDG